LGIKLWAAGSTARWEAAESQGGGYKLSVGGGGASRYGQKLLAAAAAAAAGAGAGA